MPTPTYTPLATRTIPSNTALITFSNIPNTYRDLIIVQNTVMTQATGYTEYRFNSDASAVYSVVNMRGNGTTTASSSATTNTGIAPFSGFTEGTTQRPVLITYIFDYAQSKHKTVLCRGNSSGIGVVASAHRWPSTDAITTITVNGISGVFVAGGTISLYGVIA